MRTRRGLSTVVGAIFFIIAVSSIIAYISISMDRIDQFSSEIITIESQNQERYSEEFELTALKIDQNQFNITVANTGNIPIQISNLWVENKTAIDWVQKYSIDQSIPPGGAKSNIGQGVGLIAVDANSYKLKLVTERGNSEEFIVNSAGEEPINIQLSASPTKVLDQFTTTLILSVTNNMTDNNILTEIKPNLLLGGGSATATKVSGPTPNSYDTLMNGDTANFKYVYQLEGSDGQSKSFIGSIENGYPANSVSETVNIAVAGFAEESGSTIETTGLQNNPLDDDILILHQETSDLESGKQMFSSQGENPTILNTTVNPSNIWYTASNSQSNVVVPTGIWNLNLRFISDPVPDGFPLPDMIYHFEEEESFVTPDSSGNGIDLSVPSNPADPLIGETFGQHDSRGYDFDGDDYLEYSSGLTVDVNNIGSSPDSTSGWFKTSSLSRQVLFEIGDNGGEYYRIELGNALGNEGTLYFKYVTDTTKSPPQGSCSSAPFTSLNDGEWHHFVAVRDGDFTCRIYIDGSLASSGIDSSGCGSCSSPSSKIVEPSGNISLGRNQLNSNYFTGNIDQTFHWNSIALSPEEANLMFNTNYGTEAHSFDFELQKVNNLGVDIGLPFASNLFYPIGFHDSKSDSTSWSPGLIFNYTTGSLDEQTFSDGDRLKLSITHVGGLNMTIRIDDPNLNDPFSTFLQVPYPSEPFPSYFVLDNDDFPSLDIFNPGPKGVWLTYLTRLVFDDVNSNTGYASHLQEVCGTLMPNTEHITNDSPLIPSETTCNVVFHQPRNPPDSLETGDFNLIPPGTYNVRIYLAGYDEGGSSFNDVIDLGTIQVKE